MRKSAILVLLLVSAAAMRAQTRITLDQFERMFETLPKGDERAAALISPYELTERVSLARLTRWQSMVQGSRTRDVLLALAGASAFQPLPSAEVPATPMPDAPTRAAIIGRATEYVENMRPRLPNFTAVHQVTQFEIALRTELEEEERGLQFQLMSSARMHYHPLGSAGLGARNLYLLGTTTGTVTYSNGAEVRSPVASNKKRNSLVPNSLNTWGEFGPILLVVTGDAAHGHIDWDHWENGPSGPLAVFRYQVPKDHSHFAIYATSLQFTGITPLVHYPAYHGEIAIDPADGSILRIAILADADPHDPEALAAIVVEYGPVTIGDRNYICPVHGIALNAQSVSPANGARPAPGEVRKYINDVSFSDYHMFRSDSRVIADPPPQP